MGLRLKSTRLDTETQPAVRQKESKGLDTNVDTNLHKHQSTLDKMQCTDGGRDGRGGIKDDNQVSTSVAAAVSAIASKQVYVRVRLSRSSRKPEVGENGLAGFFSSGSDFT